MLFNSGQFAVFFPAVTLAYFLLPHRSRWLFLLLASCAFYMAFIPSYIVILFVTIGIDYLAGIYIEGSSGVRRKSLLLLSILSTCLVLLFFKYFNFANQNLEALARFVGWNYPIPALRIILPIGLSFHTFQSLSYVIEVYRGHQKAERHFGIYALYVMFYPQLVAGPIERPQNLLYQFRERKDFDYGDLTCGLRLMAWGFFKKIVIADRLALFVNPVYDNAAQYSGFALCLATIGFAYQIYCDFSGYSDIAIGAARVMGFRLMRNFNQPYVSQSVGEFWKRWHISLSTWFRDYVYIPLGGNRVGRVRFYRNLFLTFLISGLWHGANWTYIIWGGLNGVYLIGGHLLAPWRRRLLQACGFSGNEAGCVALRVVLTFCLICLGWVFFRAGSFSEAIFILKRMATEWNQNGAAVAGFGGLDVVIIAASIVLLELGQRLGEAGIMEGVASRWPAYARWPVYYAFIACLLMFGVFQGSRFVYFQF